MSLMSVNWPQRVIPSSRELPEFHNEFLHFPPPPPPPRFQRRFRIEARRAKKTSAGTPTKLQRETLRALIATSVAFTPKLG